MRVSRGYWYSKAESVALNNGGRFKHSPQIVGPDFGGVGTDEGGNEGTDENDFNCISVDAVGFGVAGFDMTDFDGTVLRRESREEGVLGNFDINGKLQT